MSTIITQQSYPYGFDATACNSCQGRCCTGESGYIYVTRDEVHAIAELLELRVEDFIQRYLFKKGYKYSIKERRVGESYECVFYDSEANGCLIYQARPKQCQTFPFWEYYKTRVDELKKECPGIVDV